ncbi:MAG: Multi-sensor signal transduction histidine kinase [Parcubacteria group bacterium GW2011_GWA2_47_16]|nr:MAG: Multi-sensor signal transduction histidine kinase [Parcubacteria group bacterium GW2011_GWA2_47_16]
MKIKQPAVTAKALHLKVKELAVTAREKEVIRRKLAVTARKLSVKAKQLAVTAKNLGLKAKELAVVAKEKEVIRQKLAVTAEELCVKAKELAVTAKEKESIRLKLAVTAEKLRHKARELAEIAKEKELVRQKLAVTAEALRLKAKELAVTAEALRGKAKELALIALEKEEVRQKLAVTAEELRINAEEQAKIEAYSKESEVRYRRLFETAHDGILILNSKTGQITDVNPYLEKLLGYSKSEFLNKKLWEVGAFKNLKAAKDAFKILQKDGYLRYEDLPLETKDGRSIEVEFVSNSYMAGETLVIQCNIRDITERKRLDLIKETKRLLDEERSKVESIADATHELRTPIAIIKGNVDLALQSKEKNPKSAKSALRAINYEIKHLSSILSELSLVTSKAWELKNRIFFEKLNLRSLISVVVERCKALAYKKNVSITTGKIPDVTILGDKMYLEKMLINLIRNSIIYGHKNGHTGVSVENIKDGVVISITDNGIGISPEDLPHVFERFYRADKFHSSGGSSIGLGLAIVKWIAEVHGGTVSAESVKDKGSVFSVFLPIKTAVTQ